MVFKLDVHLEGLAERQPAVQSLKAGQQLQLRREEDGTLACVTSDGGVVGVVPAAHMPQLNTAAHFSGAVRSLKRRPGESEVVELLARFTAGQPPPRPSGTRRAWDVRGAAPPAARGRALAAPEC